MYGWVYCAGTPKIWVYVKKRTRKRPLFCVSKASPSGLRPQARVEAQSPEAALSAETEAAARRRLMRAELANASREWVIAAHSPLIRPRAGLGHLPPRGKATLLIPPPPPKSPARPRRGSCGCPWRAFRSGGGRRSRCSLFSQSNSTLRGPPAAAGRFCPAAMRSRSAARPGACSCWPRSARPAGTVRR